MNFLMKFLLVVVIVGCVDQLFSYMPNQVRNFKNALQKNMPVNCSGCDFRGSLDFVDLDAQGVFMPGVSFQPCVASEQNQNSMMVCIAQQPSNLAGINLAGAILFSSNFDGAILQGANLSNADLTDSSLQYANLQDANLEKAITQGATFCNAVMPDGQICTTTWQGQGVTIECNCSASQTK